MAAHATQPTRGAWQDGLDLPLMRRLLRPLLRPGLIGQGLARRILGQVSALRGRVSLSGEVLARHSRREGKADGVPVVHGVWVPADVSDAPRGLGAGSAPPVASVAAPGLAAKVLEQVEVRFEERLVVHGAVVPGQLPVSSLVPALVSPPDLEQGSPPPVVTARPVKLEPENPVFAISSNSPAPPPVPLPASPVTFSRPAPISMPGNDRRISAAEALRLAREAGLPLLPPRGQATLPPLRSNVPPGSSMTDILVEHPAAPKDSGRGDGGFVLVPSAGPDSMAGVRPVQPVIAAVTSPTDPDPAHLSYLGRAGEGEGGLADQGLEPQPKDRAEIGSPTSVASIVSRPVVQVNRAKSKQSTDIFEEITMASTAHAPTSYQIADPSARGSGPTRPAPMPNGLLDEARATEMARPIVLAPLPGAAPQSYLVTPLNHAPVAEVSVRGVPGWDGSGPDGSAGPGWNGIRAGRGPSASLPPGSTNQDSSSGKTETSSRLASNSASVTGQATPTPSTQEPRAARLSEPEMQALVDQVQRRLMKLGASDRTRKGLPR